MNFLDKFEIGLALAAVGLSTFVNALASYASHQVPLAGVIVGVVVFETMTSLTLAEPSGELLKTDTLGRVRTPRARREAILDEFERGGGSGAQFAALLGIKYSTLANWIQVRRRERRRAEVGAESFPTASRSAEGSAPVWLEAVFEKDLSQVDRGFAAPSAESACGMVRLQLPGGAVVEFAQLGQVPLIAGLLRELEYRKPPGC